jgi:hypothetical protein
MGRAGLRPTTARPKRRNTEGLVRIEDGSAESHTPVLPLDASAIPAVVAATRIFPSGTEQGGVRDAAAERLAQLAASQAECAAAQAFGMSADADRRTECAAAMLPLAATYGDEMTLPAVISDWSKHTRGSDATDYDPAG